MLKEYTVGGRIASYWVRDETVSYVFRIAFLTHDRRMFFILLEHLRVRATSFFENSEEFRAVWYYYLATFDASQLEDDIVSRKYIPGWEKDAPSLILAATIAVNNQRLTQLLVDQKVSYSVLGFRMAVISGKNINFVLWFTRRYARRLPFPVVWEVINTVCKSGHLDLIRELCSIFPYIFQQCLGSVIYEVSNSQCEVVEFLLDTFGNQYKFRGDVIEKACERHQHRIVRLLLKHLPDVKIPTKMPAAYIWPLLKLGADPKQLNYYKKTIKEIQKKIIVRNNVIVKCLGYANLPRNLVKGLIIPYNGWQYVRS
jgi:hypothetical protein